MKQNQQQKLIISLLVALCFVAASYIKIDASSININGSRYPLWQSGWETDTGWGNGDPLLSSLLNTDYVVPVKVDFGNTNGNTIINGHTFDISNPGLADNFNGNTLGSATGTNWSISNTSPAGDNIFTGANGLPLGTQAVNLATGFAFKNFDFDITGLTANQEYFMYLAMFGSDDLNRSNDFTPSDGGPVQNIAMGTGNGQRLFRYGFTSNGSGAFSMSKTNGGSIMDGVVVHGIFVVEARTSADFSPGGVSPNLTLWYRADSVDDQASGSAVPEWQDFSGNNFDGLQANEAARPAYTLSAANNVNFNPMLAYDGGSDYFPISGLSYTGTGALSHIFSCTVFRSNQTGGGFNSNWAFVDFDRSEYYDYYIRPDTGQISFSYAAGGINDNDSVGTGFNDDRTHIACVNYDSSIVNDTEIRVDGNQELSADIEALSQTVGTTTTRFGFSGEGSEAPTFDGARNNIFYGGDIAETIYFSNRSITTAERQRIESYLATKYAVTLNQSGTGQNYFDSSGNIIFDADTAGAGSGFMNAYNDDIAGIGRDDASALYQIKSQSDNTDGTVAMSNGSSLDNQDFLFWGNDNDDNGIIDIITTEIPAGLELEERVDREWRVDETGDVGTVSVTFANGTAGLKASSANDIFILLDSDSDFSNGILSSQSATSIGSGGAVFEGVNFADANFFTFASRFTGPGGIEDNIAIWYKADTLSQADNSPITSILDVSGSNNSASQPNAGSEPTFIDSGDSEINFNPALQFDNVDDYLAIENKSYNGVNSLNQIFTCAIFRTNTTGGSSDIWAFIDFDRSDYFNFNVRADTGQVRFSYNGAAIRDNDSAGTGFNDNNAHLACASYDSAVANDTEIRVDGNLELSADVEAAAQAIGSANTRFGFVGDGSEATTFDGARNGFYYQGEISELVLYENKSFVANEIERLESYFATKYGLTLDQTGTGRNYLNSNGDIIFDADTAGAGSGFMNAYNDDIAGIGRDDNGNLRQIQSRSENSDATVIMTNGSSLDDGDFIFWGNDNDDDGTAEEITTEIPPGVNSTTRIDREWRVDTTGNIGTVDVQFDIRNIGIRGALAEDFTLFIDDDSDFSADVTSTQLADSFSTGIVTFKNVTFVEGDFFTLGGTISAPGGVTDNLDIWYKVNSLAGTADGTNIDTINDLSGQGNRGLQPTTNNQPLFKNTNGDEINFNPVAQFDGTADYLAVENRFYNGATLNQIFSCTVFRSNFVGASFNDNWAFLDFDRSEVFDYYVRPDTGQLGFSYRTSATRDNSSTVTGLNNDQPHIGCIGYDSSITNDTFMRVNGNIELSSDIEIGGVAIGTTISTRFGFVGDGSESSTFNNTRNNIFYDGDIAEIVHYVNKTMTSSEIDRIESYLGLKYGITLDQSGTGQNYFSSNGDIIFDADTAGAGSGFMNGFNNDIAGIGSDKLSGLFQPTSRSVNTDAIVTIGNASGLDNGEFLFWGNDNDDDGIVEATQNGAPLSFVNSILDRTWQFNETGDVGTVTISFNFNGTGLIDPFLDTLKLITDNDSDLSDVTTLIDATSVIDTTVSFEAVDVSNASFFTLGVIDSGQLFFGMPY